MYNDFSAYGSKRTLGHAAFWHKLWHSMIYDTLKQVMLRCYNLRCWGMSSESQGRPLFSWTLVIRQQVRWLTEVETCAREGLCLIHKCNDVWKYYHAKERANWNSYTNYLIIKTTTIIIIEYCMKAVYRRESRYICGRLNKVNSIGRFIIVFVK